MQGWVKFYNKAKGFGFIYTKNELDNISFNIRDWKDVEPPKAGYEVDFETTPTKNGGIRAINVFLIKKDLIDSKDERVVCHHCGKKIVPRISFYNGQPRKSYCPYCGGVIKNFSMCFIATAVYGDENHQNVEILRNFRDDYLIQNKLGRNFVRLYYKYSPPIANFIKYKSYLSLPIRGLLNVFTLLYTKYKRKFR